MLLVAGLVMAGCSGGSEQQTANQTSTGSSAGQGETFKVALLTPGPVSDSGWNALAYDGLQAIKSSMNAQVDTEPVEDPAKIKDAMRSYAQHGYNLIFGHGFEYNEPAIAVAKDFPDTVFLSSSGGKTAPNVGAFRFYLEQGCYLEGMLAARMSKTGAIGSVAAVDVPSIKSTIQAFEAGARAANSSIKIIPTVYLGQGMDTDPARAKQATEQVIAQGADFVIHQANAAAQGVFDACKEKGVWALGTNLNQNDNSSGVVIASSVINAKPAFLDVAQQVKDKKFKGSIVLMGMDKGAIDFVLNPKLSEKVPEDVQRLLEATKDKIVAGSLVVPKIEF